MTNLSMKILKSLKDDGWVSYRDLSDRFRLADLPKDDMYTAELLAALCVEKKRDEPSPVNPPPDADCTFFKITVNGINLLEEHLRKEKKEKRETFRYWFSVLTADVLSIAAIIISLLSLLQSRLQ